MHKGRLEGYKILGKFTVSGSDDHFIVLYCKSLLTKHVIHNINKMHTKLKGHIYHWLVSY